MTQLFVSEPILFTQIGNRRGFTGLQLMRDRAALDFFNQFRDRFEPGPMQIDCVLFIEQEDDQCRDPAPRRPRSHGEPQW